MTVIKEGQRTGEFLVSESNGQRGRKMGVVDVGQVLEAGHVVGKLTTGGNLAEWNPANTDGSENVAGILYDNIDATTAAKSALYIESDTVVNFSELIFFTGADSTQKDTAKVELEALGIIAR